MSENNSKGGSSPREGFRPGLVPKVTKRLYKTERLTVQQYRRKWKLTAYLRKYDVPS